MNSGFVESANDRHGTIFTCLDEDNLAGWELVARLDGSSHGHISLELLQKFTSLANGFPVNAKMAIH
ncbi:hypothetical protein [Armatimonas sp.]|uniref:hypothetical protein n=1 Tax=Armatimonas sp. TaxID=1872638 RepID=UPI003753051C